MNNQDLALFTDHLFKIFGRKTEEIRKIASLNANLSPIYVFIFKDYPYKKLTTFVTYGLSEMSHPKWHFGRPEVILSVESNNEIWGRGLTAIINRFRGEKVFSNGSTYVFDTPLTSESDMTGFVIFKPNFLSQEETVLQLPQKTIYFIQAYPIYSGEAALIERQGFETFWMDEGLRDVYDVEREEILGEGS